MALCTQRCVNCTITSLNTGIPFFRGCSPDMQYWCWALQGSLWRHWLWYQTVCKLTAQGWNQHRSSQFQCTACGHLWYVANNDDYTLLCNGAGVKTPGPDYRPNSPYWGRGPQHHIGVRLKPKSAETPGPGEQMVHPALVDNSYHTTKVQLHMLFQVMSIQLLDH